MSESLEVGKRIQKSIYKPINLILWNDMEDYYWNVQREIKDNVDESVGWNIQNNVLHSVRIEIDKMGK